MIIKHIEEVPEERSNLKGTKGCMLRWLIAKKDGAQNYAMRLFELQPRGIIPIHTHEKSEHEIFIVQGTALLDDGSKTIEVRQGDAIFVQPGEKHSFKNNSNHLLKFICVIPI